MSYTVEQATHPTRSLKLPCGQALTIHRVRNPHRKDAVEQYAKFLEPIAIILDRAPTQDEAHSMIPDVMCDTYREQIPIPDAMEQDDPEMAEQVRNLGRTAVLAFLNMFSDTPLTPEQVDAWDIDDFGAAWAAIWEIARYPFGVGFTAVITSNRLDSARADWKRMNPPNSPSSSAPDSTPETPPSKSSTASPSPRPRRNTRSATPPKSATGPAKPTPPPTPGNGPT